MSDDVLAFPGSRNCNLTAIRTYVVFFIRNIRGIVLKLVTPCITYIYIDGIAIAMKFPNSRNRYVIPSLIIEADFPEISWAGIGILHPIELPGTIQGHEVGWIFLDSFLGRIIRFVSKIIGVHRCTVDGIDFRVFPFLERLSSHG